MAFTTITFLLFAFFVALIYFLFPNKKYQWTVLLAASYFFYLWASFRIAVFLLLTTFTVYGAALWMERVGAAAKEELALHKKEWDREQKKAFKEQVKKKRRRILIAVLVLNFGILSFLKYFNFLAGSLNGLLALAGLGEPIPILRLLLPLGISFYTFQSTGYLIDVYREKYGAEHNPFKYALFVSFFPQIIQGPISFYDQLAHQLYASHSFSFTRLKYGLWLMLWGYFKKMVIADRGVALINTVTADDMAYNGTVLFLTILMYALQLYADFSGGIDISRGLAEVLGIEMPENFRRPYFAVDINDYWRRWHITLGAWLKNYVFYSVATSNRFLKMGKNMKARFGQHPAGAHVAKVFPTCVASLITFLIVGIWHGANWKYVAFGVWNGGVIMISILLQPLYAIALAKLHIRAESRGWHLFQILRTLLVVLVGYAFDIGSNFTAAMRMMWRCVTDFSWNFQEIGCQLQICGLDFLDYMVILAGGLVILCASLIQERHSDTTIRSMLQAKSSWVQFAAVLAILGAIAVFGVYGPGYNTADFVYMQF